MSHPTIIVNQLEVLGDTAYSLTELSVCSGVSPEWLLTHVSEGTIEPSTGSDPTSWRFTHTSVQRVHRIAYLEHTYDADLQLAALAADLMEEVARLRQRLQADI